MVFQPGYSPNPEGARLAKTHKRKLAAEILGRSMPLAVRAINKALRGKDPGWAARLCFEYVYGKAPQSIELSGSLNGGVIPQINITLVSAGQTAIQIGETQAMIDVKPEYKEIAQEVVAVVQDVNTDNVDKPSE